MPLNDPPPSPPKVSWNYVNDLLFATITTVTTFAVGYIVGSYVHNRFYAGEEISRENKDKIAKIFKKWGMNPNDLNLNEHEWAIAMNLMDPDSLNDVSWSDIAGCANEIQKLKHLVILPANARLNRENESTACQPLLQSPKGVLIHGPPGVGKTLLAKVLAKETHCRLLKIDPSKTNGKFVGDSEKLSAAMFTLAEKLEPCIVFIDEIDSVLKSRTSNDNNNLIAATKGIFLSYWDGVDAKKTVLVLGTTNRPKDIDPGFLRRFDVNLELKLPDLAQRKSILEMCVKSQHQSLDECINLDDIVYDMNGFSGADIKEICRQAVIYATDQGVSENKPLKLQPRNFEQAIIDSKKSRNSCGGFGGLDEYEMKIASSVLTPDDLNAEWEDIAGLDEVIERLNKNVILPLMACRNPELVQSGLIQPPKGILLYGEPGCGKTLLAKAIAKHVKCTFINLQPSDLQGTFYGDTSKNVRALFSLAMKYEPCIIFIDEIDSLFRQRQACDHETTSVMKTTFMSLWDGILTNSKAPKTIIVLGATNRPDSIDDAILRRLPEKINIPLPNQAQREKILKIILKKELLVNVDLAALARCTDGLSGSDLKEICRNAAINSMHSMSVNSTGLIIHKMGRSSVVCTKAGAGDRPSDIQAGINGLSADEPEIKSAGQIDDFRVPITAAHFKCALDEFLASRVR